MVVVKRLFCRLFRGKVDKKDFARFGLLASHLALTWTSSPLSLFQLTSLLSSPRLLLTTLPKRGDKPKCNGLLASLLRGESLSILISEWHSETIDLLFNYFFIFLMNNILEMQTLSTTLYYIDKLLIWSNWRSFSIMISEWLSETIDFQLFINFVYLF